MQNVQTRNTAESILNGMQYARGEAVRPVIGLDTNVLVRLIVQDDALQTAAAELSASLGHGGHS